MRADLGVQTVVYLSWPILWAREQYLHGVGHALDHYLNRILVSIKMLDLYASIFFGRDLLLRMHNLCAHERQQGQHNDLEVASNGTEPARIPLPTKT